MITKEHKIERTCLFCASDYHLEMILLPYIKDRLDKYNFLIFTENNLEESINFLLTKVNLDEKDKEKIKNLNWKNTDEIKFKQLEKNKNLHIIINGCFSYIKYINNRIKEFRNKELEIVDCYHVGDSDVDILEISKKYNSVLNTQKI